jgi:hypothetical protein
MRKNLVALQILAALLVVAALGATTAGAASVRTLKAHQISSSAGWVGQVDATTLAYGASTIGSGTLVLRDGTSTPKVIAPPAGPECKGAAAGAGHLLFTCYLGYNYGVSARRAVITAADGTVQTSIDYNMTDAADPDGIGAQWIHHQGGCYHCGVWSADVNWHTGEVRKADLSALTGYEDLDAPGLVAPLCAPLKQNPLPDGVDEGNYQPSQLGMQVSGKWALQGVWDKADGRIAWQLRHCGTTKVYKTPAGTTPVAIAGGFVVLAGKGGNSLLRLRDMRSFRLGGVTGAAKAAATGRRMLILGSGEPANVWSVALPQK